MDGSGQVLTAGFDRHISEIPIRAHGFRSQGMGEDRQEALVRQTVDDS